MWLLIDGDNAPGETRTVGADRLDPVKDKLIVFYGTKNPYYNSKTNREKLREQASCEVTYIRIDQGSNAVDFAMAIYAGNICSQSGNDELLLTLVSGDRHLSIVERELARLYDTCSIKCVQTVDEALVRYQLIEADTAEDIKNVLCNQYGSVHGQKLYFKLKDCFITEDKTTPKSLKQRVRTALTAVSPLLSRKDS